MTVTIPEPIQRPKSVATMRAVVFHDVNDIRVEEVPRPRPARVKPSSGSR